MALKNFTKPISFCLAIVMLAIILCIPVTAVPPQVGAADTSDVESGWVEAHAAVPEDFRGVVILSIENQETLDEYDIECLPDNNYVGSAKVPAGEYLVSMAFVYQNYTYTVTPAPTDFIVESGSEAAATTIALSVAAGETTTPDPEEEIPVEEPVSDTEEEIIADPDVEDILDKTEEVPSDETIEEEETGMSFFRELLFELAMSLLGALILAGLVFGVCWLYRKYQENNS